MRCSLRYVNSTTVGVRGVPLPAAVTMIGEVFTFGPDQARRNVVEGAPTAYASAIHIRE